MFWHSSWYCTCDKRINPGQKPDHLTKEEEKILSEYYNMTDTNTKAMLDILRCHHDDIKNMIQGTILTVKTVDSDHWKDKDCLFRLEKVSICTIIKTNAIEEYYNGCQYIKFHGIGVHEVIFKYNDGELINQETNTGGWTPSELHKYNNYGLTLEKVKPFTSDYLPKDLCNIVSQYGGIRYEVDIEKMFHTYFEDLRALRVKRRKTSEE